MTTVKFNVKEKYICSFEISGHAMYSDETDIVCAAISSCAYMVANTITDIYGIEADICVEDGYFNLKIGIDDARNCHQILDGFELHLNELAQQYPNNIACFKKTIS